MARCFRASSKGRHNIRIFLRLSQLRQLRTRFSHMSTYLRCRSFNEPTDDLTIRPYTIFTLADWDNGADDADYRLASKLMQPVALAVFKGSSDRPPTLRKQEVLAMQTKLKEGGAVFNVFQRVVSQYATVDTVAVIGNSALNEELQKLANLLASPISKANESVRHATAAVFPV